MLSVVVHSAKIQDLAGAKLVFERCKSQSNLPLLEHIWADAGYQGLSLAEYAKERLGGCRLEIVRKHKDQKGFVLLPRRWVVERTFAWLGNYRRLTKDYERSASTTEAFIYIAMTHLMLKRLTT